MWRTIPAGAVLLAVCVSAVGVEEQKAVGVEEQKAVGTEERKAAGEKGRMAAPPEAVRSFAAGVRQAFPGVSEWRTVRVGVYELLGGQGKMLGKLLVETIPDGEREFGYAGTIEVAIVLDAEERVAGVLIGKNRETPAFLNRVRAKKFLESWNALAVAGIPGREVDTVTGATLSSNAIRSGVRKLAEHYLRSESAVAAEPAPVREDGTGEVVRLEKRIAATRRILAGSNTLLRQLRERREDHLKLQFIAAVEGREAAGEYAKKNGLMYFNHPGRNRETGPVERAAAEYRESNSEASREKLNRALREECERLLLAVPPHNAEHEKSLSAMERRLASLKAGAGESVP